MDKKKRRGRPICLDRLADPLVVIEIPLSVRNKLSEQKTAQQITYGDLIAEMLKRSQLEGVEWRQ